MQYSLYELLFFLILYSFLGWCLEVAYVSVRTGRFINRGLFSLPLCLSYGFAAVLLQLILPTLEGAYGLQAVACMVVTSACAQLADEMSARVTGKRLWDQEIRSVYSGRLAGLIYALAMGAAALLVILLVHPLLLIFCEMLPKLLLRIVVWAVCLLLLADFSVIYYTSKKKTVSEEMQTFSEGLKEQKKSLGNWISRRIWARLWRAYPNLKVADDKAQAEERYIFARGLCMDKVIWIFFITAFGGDLIETFYVKLTADIWMSRSSVLYGTFSIVWGVGAAILTLLLRDLAQKEDRYIFLGGFFLGGTYEYMCSVFTEVFFGTTFWDYSDMPFNIGGRTNLLFCVFWGILALVWVKICYPRLSCLIERIPPVAGKVVTWACVALMACDILISAMAMVRYVERQEGLPAHNRIEQFVDGQYPDEFIEWVWPNLRIS